MSLFISHTTIIDGTGRPPMEGCSVWTEGSRIKAIGRSGELPIPASAKVIDGDGKYVIPGLMDANVHLLLDIRMENLVRFENQMDDLICEAAQVALKNGLTTVFDTWGPRGALVKARERIRSGSVPGSRIFCGGNIIGLDGPFSQDFLSRIPEIASGCLVDRINALWEENVGSDLTWMTPDEVARAVRTYIEHGVDFIKYASSEHRLAERSAFLAFSPLAQNRIVAQAHHAGITAQAHSSSVEALRVAVEAGADIIQHCNMTGPTPIPTNTLDMLCERGTSLTVFPFTKQRYEKLMRAGDQFTQRMFSTADVNIRNLIRSSARLLLATDGGLLSSEAATHPVFGKSWVAAGEDNLAELGAGHFHWMKAMEEKGLGAMEILKAATLNIAAAYGKERDLGSIEEGKLADMVVLDRNPLRAAENYRSIHAVVKDGVIVNRDSLPLIPMLTASEGKIEERRVASSRGSSAHPLCC